MPLTQGISVILCDIEGTTTSISYVKDVLFPYARKEIESFLKVNWDRAEVQDAVELVKKQAKEDLKNGTLDTVYSIPEGANEEELQAAVVSNLLWQMDNDRKTTGLKALQGMIWRKGYEIGVLQGHIYDDVPLAFERWTEAGKKICIYSSGSVQAQVLLFENSKAGDLTKFLSGYYDTTCGPKIEASSYKTIASKIGVAPSEILFLTDVAKEAYAAKEAGIQVKVLIRPGNAQLTPREQEELKTVQSFDEL